MVRAPSRVFRTAQTHRQADYGGDTSAKKHPDRLVRGRAGKEPGHVGTERVHGVETEEHEPRSTNEQGQGNDFIHNFLLV